VTSAPAVHPAPDNHVAADVDARLTRMLDKLAVRRDIHHAVVAVERGDGSRRWSAAVGPAGVESPFFVASITKRFIVALVLQANERGELDLSAPISRYLPADTLRGLHVLGGVDHTSAITVRHLASHTSGLPDFFEKRRSGTSIFADLHAGRDRAWTFDDVLTTNRELQRPHFPPQDLTATRQKARYSDTGFQLLIRILVAVTGRTFADLVADRITGPLGLTHTGFTTEHLPLHKGRQRVELPGMVASSNDLISTAGDLLAFQRALLAGRLFDDASTVALLTERRNRLRNIPILRYGLGTMTFTVGRLMAAGRRPVTLVGHSGVTGTWLFHCPERDLHMVGTVDQTSARPVPFRIMARSLYYWRD
jgi:D-alanyl-D-alanine carboxypeptidase